MNRNNGFTIVELLIVIVVIAILAAITVVAYNGVQDRSINAASLSAANQVEKQIRSYYAVNSAYPHTARTCAVESACYLGGAVTVNATYRTNISSVGPLPGGIPTWSTTYGGVLSDYVGSRTYEGEPVKTVVIYFLKGANLNCNREVANTPTGATLTKSTTGNSGFTGGTTFCSIPLTGLE